MHFSTISTAIVVLRCATAASAVAHARAVEQEVDPAAAAAAGAGREEAGPPRCHNPRRAPPRLDPRCQRRVLLPLLSVAAAGDCREVLRRDLRPDRDKRAYRSLFVRMGSSYTIASFFPGTLF